MIAQAAILHRLNTPLIVEEIVVPAPGVGQALVEVRASGICGAQIREMTGAKGEDKYLPHLMGHEGAGVVIEVGPGVRKVKAGDHVVLHWRKGSGIESECPVYGIDGGYAGGGWVTTFNTHALISENRMTAIPKDIDFGVAALLGCAVTTGLGVINNEAILKMGQSIAVAGVGGVGLNVIQGATMVSAHPIIAIDLLEEKREMAKNFGATQFFTNTDELPPVDVFVDCTGSPEVIKAGLKSLLPGGKLILVGQPRQGQDVVFEDMQKDYRGITIMDSQGGLTNPDTDIHRYIRLYQAGKLELDKLITRRYKLKKINQAIEFVKSGQSGRVIVEMDIC